MPNGKTFAIPPVAEFVGKYTGGRTSVDPFAGWSATATHRNDLRPSCGQPFCMDAENFLLRLAEMGVECECGLFDPPYSPRQISEWYKEAGLPVTSETTRNAALFKRVRDALDRIVPRGGYVLSFGWHSNGMGKGRGYEIEEVLLVAHGGAHNDTICIAERKL